MSTSIETVSKTRIFAGEQGVYRHKSSATGTDMEFSVFVPDQASEAPLPVLFYLSGLTCNWENFTTKAGAQRYASEHGIIIVCPDTSPRGEDVPDDEGYDFGQGAGFYVNATQEPWAQHYQMYDYVVSELPALIAAHFPVDASRQSIFGHSMGGHGALTIALRNPDKFKSVSALAPIVAPAQIPWGHKALGGYLGPDKTTWLEHDTCALVKSKGWSRDILVDQGLDDEFLEHLQPDMLAAACKEANVDLTLRLHEGYGHSYYFISTFVGDHIKWHADRLK